MRHYSDLLEDVGFVRGSALPVVLYHSIKDMYCVVHGDDFTLNGKDHDLVLDTEIDGIAV